MQLGDGMYDFGDDDPYMSSKVGIGGRHADSIARFVSNQDVPLTRASMVAILSNGGKGVFTHNFTRLLA